MPKKNNPDRELPKNVRLRDGKYSYRYRVPTTKIVNGVEKKSSKEMESPRFDTIEEAEQFGILIQAQKIQKRLKYETNLTINAWSKVWLKEYQIENEPSKNTIKTRKSNIKATLDKFGAFALRDVTPNLYQTFLYDLKERGKSKNTIIGIHTAAHLMFAHAKRKGLIKTDPTEEARVPKDKKPARKPGEKRLTLPKFLEKEQVKKFLEVARFTESTNNWALFLIMTYTGLRISEAAGLQWEDIDMVNQTIDVNKQIGGTNVRKYTFEPTKNEQSERVVYYGDTVARAFEALSKWQEAERSAAKDFNRKDNFVFWSSDNPGYPIAVTAVGVVMRRVLKAAGLPESLTPHSLRHTHVSLLASNPRVSLPEIQARIGHRSGSKVTELIYLHVTQNRQKQMKDDFEWAINS